MHKFKTNCSRDKLKEIRAFVSKVVSDVGVCEKDANRIVLAVDEVCANLIIHSNNCKSTQHLELFIQDNGEDKIIFEITDRGNSFDYGMYKEPNLKDIIKARKKGGVGMMLVRSIMDEVEFTVEKNRNICRMVKIFERKQ